MHRILISMLGAASTLLGVRGLAAQSADTVADRVFHWATAETPGCAAGVARDGRTVLSRAYGMANLEHGAPFTPQTISDGGSIAKQFTAAAILLLAGDGKLSLDDPVQRHFPELKDLAPQVTIRHLLNHTSGLREWQDLALFTGWTDPDVVYANADVLEMASRQRTLNFPPGSKFSYSNTGYILAAILVGRVSGMSFAEFTRQRIFEPLGMSSTHWSDDHTRVVKGRATGYQPAAGGFRTKDALDDAHGSGGLFSTVGDLLKWNEALTAGSVVPAEMVRLMETPVHPVSPTLGHGMGLWVGEHRGEREVEHGGISSGYRAFIARYPGQRISVAVLCNSRSADVKQITYDLVDGVLGRKPAQPAAVAAVRPPAVLTPAQLAAHAGVYRDTATGAPLRVGARDGAWHYPGTIRYSAGALLPSSPTTFSHGNGIGRGDFVSGEQVKGLRMWLTARGDTIFYERMPDWAPAAAELSEYVGTYRSEEANTTWTIERQDGGLLLRLGRPRRATPLVPAYRDVFSSAIPLVAFQRDAAGSITGLTATTQLSWGVVFVRQ